MDAAAAVTLERPAAAALRTVPRGFAELLDPRGVIG